ncbi:hypothetical protein KPH14_006148 [Odynerus spinipes]|uniref:Uncharacterized protein n=1 Tax=Odynerus spinipes TaxID=1348599 RepID=A0AAD9VMM2_9HYME|nr:hypothetical protein KPH14_006148 [Odynerus spinipes]
MIENVYVIKVKTKPALSSLYPSERRYSASTVGGLALVHFGLGALSLLLGTLALAVQGPILSIACLVPFITGLLAWRRWYIDRNITIFFCGNLFSLVVAILCFVITILDIAAVTETRNGSLWPLEKILHASGDPLIIDNTNMSDLMEETTMRLGKFDNDSIDGQDRTLLYDDLKGESSILYERSMLITGNELEKYFDNKSNEASIRMLENDKVLSFWQRDHQESSHTGTLLNVNVLVVSLLEVFWSLLSAKIALRGMMNRSPEIGHNNNISSDKKRTESTGHKRKPPPPRPDILDHDRGLSGSSQNMNSMSSLQNGTPSLPLPESSREFRERVERFLANQAALRIVEGSCT